jgi:S-adenosylmethionine decarboxylase proenzyme
MRHAAEAAKATVVSEVIHPYAPHGVTGVFVIKESHFSLHTWPEARYAAVDFYTCGDCEPERAQEVLQAGLEAERCESMHIERGLLGADPLLRVERESKSSPRALRVRPPGPRP